MVAGLRTLETFAALFQGRRYLHRASNLGDQVAAAFQEDLVALGRSRRLLDSVAARERGLGPRNKAVTPIRMRRGHGTLGLLIDPASALAPPGFAIARGAIATIDCGVEVKILNKAMIKQIDRVVNDLGEQVAQWRGVTPRAIAVAILGINHAPFAVAYEGERATPTDGRGNKHPIQEAAAACDHILRRVVAPGVYDEVLMLRYTATNTGDYPFAWVDEAAARAETTAALIRVSRLMDERL